MKNIKETLNKTWDFAVIGAGIGSLTAAAPHAKDGKNIIVLEPNYLSGGCVSSYYRKGFTFETGATTLVGLDENMPLKYVLDQTGIKIDSTQLNVPMKVHLNNGLIATRHLELEKWIKEAEHVFGKKNQRSFWKYCLKVSQFV